MRKILASMLFGLCALFMMSAALAADGLYFVGNDDELNVALEAADKGHVGGVAVDQSFYFGSAKKRKDQMRALMVGARDAGALAYIYGNDLDLGLAKEVLEFPDTTQCASAVVVVTARVSVQGRGRGLVGTCAQKNGQEQISSDEFRDLIRENYTYLKPQIRQMQK